MTPNDAAFDGSVTTIVDADVGGRLVDVRIESGRITGLEASLPRSRTTVVDAGGSALLPGLHDHHLHLLAMAARQRSIDVSDAPDAAGFDERVRSAVDGGTPSPTSDDSWIRVVGLDDRHGRLDRSRLDALAPGRPVRVQHRSGAGWVLNSVALERVGRESDDGWFLREDEHLLEGWGVEAPPDLAGVGARLAALGVTGVTDTTPFADPTALHLLSAARADGSLSQRVVCTGGPALAGTPTPPGLGRGPVKVVLADEDLPTFDRLVAAFRAARAADRTVAVHCVTRVAAVLALTAWSEVGTRPGDRIEHGSVLPVELLGRIAELGLQVVTQPGFVHARGDDYLRDVEDDDLVHLYRCASLLDAGIRVGMSTDAPFGPEDPWLAIRTAADRTTGRGTTVGAHEAISTRRALDGFLSDPADPGGPPRRIRVGAAADLCLLDRPLDRVLSDPTGGGVVATWVAGQGVHGPRT